jgi:polysaccharide export outer membrane protein
MSKIGKAIFIVCLFFFLVGCATLQADDTKNKFALVVQNDKTSTSDDIGEIKIKAFILSPGDEINITVYQHNELNRKIRIPPGGKIFYPIVGEIDTTGKSIEELRDKITIGLSNYREQTLLPGDEISITVFRNEEYNRKFIIPSDGFIFFPYVGDINVESKNLREIRKTITERLSSYVVDPQVIIDILSLNNPGRIADPQVSVEVAGFGGQKVFVLGEVNRPGVFFADGYMDVVEAITMAGGVTLDANQKSVLLIRGGKDKTKPELLLLDLERVLESGDMIHNPVLQRGDIIFLSRTFIANVDRFFEHLQKIVSPLLDIETGYWIGQNIEAGPRSTLRVAP